MNTPSILPLLGFGRSLRTFILGLLFLLALPHRRVAAQCFSTINSMQAVIDQNAANDPGDRLYSYYFCGGLMDLSDPAVATAPLQPKLKCTIGCDGPDPCVLRGAPTNYTNQILIPSDSPIIGEVFVSSLRFETTSDNDYAVHVGGNTDTLVTVAYCYFFGETGGYVLMDNMGSVKFINALDTIMIGAGTSVETLFHNAGSGGLDVSFMKSNGPFSAANIFVNSGVGNITLKQLLIEEGDYTSMFVATNGGISMDFIEVKRAKIGQNIVSAEGQGAIFGYDVLISQCQTSGATGDSWNMFNAIDGGAMRMFEISATSNRDVFRVAYANGITSSSRTTTVDILISTFSDNTLATGQVSTDLTGATAIAMAENGAVVRLSNVEISNAAARTAIGIAVSGAAIEITSFLCLTNYEGDFVFFHDDTSTVRGPSPSMRYFYTGNVNTSTGCTQSFTVLPEDVDACIRDSSTCEGVCREDSSIVLPFCQANGGTAPPAYSEAPSSSPSNMPTMPPTSSAKVSVLVHVSIALLINILLIGVFIW